MPFACGDTFVPGNVLVSSKRSFACVAGKGSQGGVNVGRLFPTSGCSLCRIPLLVFL